MAIRNTAIYKLKGPRIQGTIYLLYRDGLFSELNGADARLTAEQWSYLLRMMPVEEAQLGTAALGKLTATLVVPRSVKDKVAAFCAAYKDYRGTHYQPKVLEKANLKDVVVTDELLRVFFESPLQNFTLTNYIDRINITRDQAKNGRAGTGAFPDAWSPTFAATLAPDQLVNYRAHLRSIGLVYDAGRGTWKKPDN